jgi:hypothetical protein
LCSKCGVLIVCCKEAPAHLSALAWRDRIQHDVIGDAGPCEGQTHSSIFHYTSISRDPLLRRILSCPLTPEPQHSQLEVTGIPCSCTAERCCDGDAWQYRTIILSQSCGSRAKHQPGNACIAHVTRYCQPMQQIRVQTTPTPCRIRVQTTPTPCTGHTHIAASPGTNIHSSNKQAN